MPSATKSLKHKQAFPTQNPTTVLLIDDDSAMRTIVSVSLASFGYVVLTAQDGDMAIRSARDHPEIRLIMLDVVMSGLSGQKLAGELKVILPHSAILFCSGHPAAAMANHDIDLQCEHFLQKPCRSPELKRKLEEMLTPS